jgi:hypothetical protein
MFGNDGVDRHQSSHRIQESLTLDMKREPGAQRIYREWASTCSRWPDRRGLKNPEGLLRKSDVKAMQHHED